jgi:hypothetical protein
MTGKIWDSVYKEKHSIWVKFDERIPTETYKKMKDFGMEQSPKNKLVWFCDYNENKMGIIEAFINEFNARSAPTSTETTYDPSTSQEPQPQRTLAPTPTQGLTIDHKIALFGHVATIEQRRTTARTIDDILKDFLAVCALMD